MSELALYGTDLLGDVIKPKASGPVAERFTFPPFTVLDAKQGEWQERKRAWIAMGIQGEVGRGQNLLDGGHLRKEGNQIALAENYGKRVDVMINGAAGLYTAATSVFDPVLIELAYRWWCPDGGQIVDPFAGGSVRGIVAGALSRKYWGCDLRQEQIDANEKQADEINVPLRPVWVCGDSIEKLHTAPHADFIFSCPPYGDLERYSDDPRDLSAMDWHSFLAAYKRIILRSIQILKADSFACFVVGDFRDTKGFYRNFVSKTIEGFEECGAPLYNEAILATPVGSACLRVTKQFDSGRKLAKTHQNVLVFCKGDWRKAARKCVEAAA